MLENIELNRWDSPISSTTQLQAYEALENGKIIFLSQISFAIPDNERHLLTENYSIKKAKNISYDPHTKLLGGVKANLVDSELLKSFCSRYANHAKKLVINLFPEYASALQIGRTSYRPIEILGRKADSYKKDDTRLHVDAFAATPVHGKRLLRVFTNINPHNQARVWRVGEPFPQVAARFYPKVPSYSLAIAKMLQTWKITKELRSHYDHIMLHIHDMMKKDLKYQASIPFNIICLPPNSTWIVYTDQVSHAALMGQYVLEQTFYLPAHAMHDTTKSPLSVLENMAGKALI